MVCRHAGARVIGYRNDGDGGKLTHTIRGIIISREEHGIDALNNSDYIYGPTAHRSSILEVAHR